MSQASTGACGVCRVTETTTDAAWSSLPGTLCSSMTGAESDEDSHGPPFSRGDREQGQQGPEHVVIVKVVFLPLPWLGFHFFLLVIQILAPGKGKRSVRG